MRSVSKFILVLCFFVSGGAVFGQNPAPSPVTTGKTPVIVIPGITGSSLFDKRTNEEVWFKLRRPKGDDIRLPISTNLERNRDNLEARDIIRGVRLASFLPEIEIYERLIYALEKDGGYREASWDRPGLDAHQDTFYVFPYDWRRDNVENARLLIRRIEALKAKLKKPNLKFNIVAHSMGGLISRYAAMYGDADIPAGNLSPTWAGSRHLDRIFMLGTPNEGAILSLRGVLEGYSPTSPILTPLIHSFNRADVFTIPSMLQLLPTNESIVVYNENFEKLPIDMFDVNTWDEYDWSIWEDKDFEENFSKEEQKQAKPFFAVALKRAKRFQDAIRAGTRNGKIPVSFYLIGGDCKDTPTAALVLWDEKRARWETVIRPRSFTRTDGTRITEEEVRAKLTAKGDGTVTLKSLVNDSATEEERARYLPVSGGMFQCEDHTRLVTSSDIQDKLLGLLK